MAKNYIFFRDEGFYPIELENDLEALESVPFNPGTRRIEDLEGNIIWQEGVTIGTLDKDLDKDGATLISIERERQFSKEGWTDEKDDAYVNNELILAAMCYLQPPEEDRDSFVQAMWPWSNKWWKPSKDDRVKELVKAGALIAAEIDRLKREGGNHE